MGTKTRQEFVLIETTRQMDLILAIQGDQEGVHGAQVYLQVKQAR